MNNTITAIAGRGIPLKGDDIDTDRIIPARFLRCVTFDGLGAHAFEDDRLQTGGQHPFDQSVYQGATILVVNRNFGCGSSREHAPQALAKWGIQGIIGESFAEIFYGNCLAMGIPCVTVSGAVANQLQTAIAANPQQSITLDLPQRHIQLEGQEPIPCELGDSAQQMLVGGTWDACGQLVANAAAIQALSDRLPYIQWQHSALTA